MSKRLAYLIIFAVGMQLTVVSSFADELVGQPAPDFALRSIAGSNIRLSEFRSEVVILTFWADWCGKCRTALPELNDLNEQYQPEGLQILAVDVGGDLAKARVFADQNNIEYPVLADTNQYVSRTYQLNQMPLSVLLDREGNVRFLHKGFDSDDSQLLAAEVEGLLKE